MWKSYKQYGMSKIYSCILHEESWDAIQQIPMTLKTKKEIMDGLSILFIHAFFVALKIVPGYIPNEVFFMRTLCNLCTVF